jgi:hypothetical protein
LFSIEKWTNYSLKIKLFILTPLHEIEHKRGLKRSKLT